MSTAPQEAKKLVSKEADDEAREEAEEILNESKTQKEQGKALATVATGADKRELDTTKVQKAMSELSNQGAKQREEEAARQRELAAVKVNPADVEVIVAEFELSADKAELELRKNKGDLSVTLRELIK